MVRVLGRSPALVPYRGRPGRCALPLGPRHELGFALCAPRAGLGRGQRTPLLAAVRLALLLAEEVLAALEREVDLQQRAAGAVGEKGWGVGGGSHERPVRTLDGIWWFTGGKGVYVPFSAALATASAVGFRRCTFLCLNLGRKRSQFSLASAGSLASSRLIMSVLIA